MQEKISFCNETKRRGNSKGCFHIFLHDGTILLLIFSQKRKRSDSDSSPNKRARESSDVTVVPDRDLRDTQPGPGVILFNNLFAIGSTLNLDLARIRQLILNNLAPPRPAPQYREVNGVIGMSIRSTKNCFFKSLIFPRSHRRNRN